MQWIIDIWQKYRRRKSISGIASDFIFLCLILFMLIPATRRMGLSALIKVGLFQPKATKEVIYLQPGDLNWSLTDANGQLHTLRFPSDKPVLINFWATWCPPCIAELPTLHALYEEYHHKVDFYFISNESPQTLDAFWAERAYRLPVYRLSGSVSGALHSTGIPATFLISPQGRVIMKKTGAAKWNGSKVKHTINSLIQ